MLLSTQQILVCFLPLPTAVPRGQSRIWSAACLGLVSAVAQMCQLWTAYIWLCIYTVNEVNLWRSPQHAAFDAANSSLLSATSQ